MVLFATSVWNNSETASSKLIEIKHQEARLLWIAMTLTVLEKVPVLPEIIRQD